MFNRIKQLAVAFVITAMLGSAIAADRIKSQYLDAVLHAAEVAEIFVERVVITLRKDQR